VTQPLAVAAETCDQFLRQGREFLAQGDLASASAAGWRAAVLALEDHSGNPVADGDFRDAARTLVKDPLANANTAEWVVSAIALSDNVDDDWLDRDGVGRRLDDVQRLALLVKDIAQPPQTAEDILARSRECLANGYLAVASEKGWEAATHAAKAYAETMGFNCDGDNHFEQVTRSLEKDRSFPKEVAIWIDGASMLRKTASLCSTYPHSLHPEVPVEDSRPAVKFFHPSWLHPFILAEDLDGVGQLVAALRSRSSRSKGVIG